MDKELINFVEWLPENSGLFEGMTIEETVFKINELSTSDEGKQTLEQLTKRYKGMGLFKKGGTLDLINCLQKGGSIQNCGCGKKIEKAASGSAGVAEGNSNEKNKRRRTDRDGYAYSHNDGTQVLTIDAIGPQPLPGSYYEIEGSSPEFETQRTVQTDKGGNIKGYNYKVFNNSGDLLFPIAKYTTKRNLFNLGHKLLTEDEAKRLNSAYSVNGFENGGIVKAQYGVPRVAKSAMYDSAMELAPEVFETKKDVRTAYRTAKGWGREQGLSGRDLRNWSRNQVIDKAGAYAGDEPIPHVPLPPDGRVARSTMFEIASEYVPDFNRKDVRVAYRTAKNWGRDAGLKGSELRQYGRNKVIDRMYDYADNPVPLGSQTTPTLPVLNDDIEINDYNIEVADNFTPISNTIPQVQKMDRFGGSFNSAFRSARNSELSKFYYNGPDKKAGWYTTELAANNPTQAGGQIIEGSATAAAPQYVATPVEKSNGKTGYRFGDLLKMAAINNASKM